MGDGSWNLTEMKLQITGKILLFKTIRLESDEVFSDFRLMPQNLTFAQGVEALTAERARLAHAGDSQPAEAQKH